MAFGFHSGKNDYMACQSMINKNQGLFVSENQKFYWIKRIQNEIKNSHFKDGDVWKYIKESNPLFLKLDIPEGCYPVECVAYVYHGRKSTYFSYIFILDSKGVVTKYKVTNNKFEQDFKTTREIHSLKEFFVVLEEKDRKEREAKIKDLNDQGVTIPDGDRVTITGTIERMYLKAGFDLSRIVMLVHTDKGYQTWGNVPQELKQLAARHNIMLPCEDFNGVEITFDARVSQSKDNPLFTFFSRPTKFKISEEDLALILLKTNYE